MRDPRCISSVAEARKCGGVAIMLNKIGRMITGQFEKKSMDEVVKKLERTRTKEQPIKKSDALGALRAGMTCQPLVSGRNADGASVDWRNRVLDSLNERVEAQAAADKETVAVETPAEVTTAS